MTQHERIVELQLLLQCLQVEERIAAWTWRNPDSVIASRHSSGDGYRCVVTTPDGEVVADGRGASEADARAHAFSIVFLNEAAP